MERIGDKLKHNNRCLLEP